MENGEKPDFPSPVPSSKAGRSRFATSGSLLRNLTRQPAEDANASSLASPRKLDTAGSQLSVSSKVPIFSTTTLPTGRPVVPNMSYLKVWLKGAREEIWFGGRALSMQSSQPQFGCSMCLDVGMCLDVSEYVLDVLRRFSLADMAAHTLRFVSNAFMDPVNLQSACR
eukprot:gene19833-biopygen823